MNAVDTSDPLPRAAHAFEEHTGEVKLRVAASTAAELFEEAARALVELMGGEDGDPTPDVEEVVALDAPDREALLVDWLNELVLRAETRHALFVEFHVDRVTERQLAATVLGRRVARLRNPVKAATYHELAVREADGRYEATVILDV